MSAVGTRVYYNGVWIEGCLTKEFAQTAQRDPSNSDIWYWQYSITVEGTIVASAIDGVNLDGSYREPVNSGTAIGVLAGTNPNLSTQQCSQLILNLLRRDRGDFQYIQNGVKIVQGGIANDCNNGPKVKNVKLTRISPAVFWVSFSIDLARVECEAGQITPVPNVLGNRWSCADDIDENYLTTRTFRGVLRVSNPAVNPNDFRNLVVPTRQKGWRRLSMRFVVEQSGLELGYEIQDRLMSGEAAPNPAYTMTMTHRNIFTLMAGQATSEFTITLTGGRGTDKRELLARAAQIIRHKLALPEEPGSESTTRIKQLVLTDYSSEHKNEVEAHCQTTRAMEPPEDNSKPILADNWGVPIATFGIDDDENIAQGNRYDPDQPQTPSPYAAGGILGAFIVYQQNPCVDVHRPGANVPSPQYPPDNPPVAADQQGGVYSPAVSVRVYQGQPNNILAIPSTSDSHQEHPYTYVRMQSEFKTWFNRLFLPQAYSANAPSETHMDVAIGPPTTHRIVKYEAERTGDWPEIWNPDTFEAAGIRHVLLERKIDPKPREKSMDGHNLYVMDATYVYGLSRTPTVSDKWAIGALPWDTQTTDETSFDGAKFISPTDPHKGLGIDQGTP